MTADSKHERNEYVVHVEDETAENPPLVRKAKVRSDQKNI